MFEQFIGSTWQKSITTMKACDLALVTSILLSVSVKTLAQTTPRTIIHTGDGLFPLWWSSIPYVWGFIKLGYIFAGLLALFVYRNWVYNSEPEYGNYYQYKNHDTIKGRSDGVNIDEKIMSFGSKYK